MKCRQRLKRVEHGTRGRSRRAWHGPHADPSARTITLRLLRAGSLLIGAHKGEGGALLLRNNGFEETAEKERLRMALADADGRLDTVF
jgi:hypothetical protein